MLKKIKDIENWKNSPDALIFTYIFTPYPKLKLVAKEKLIEVIGNKRIEIIEKGRDLNIRSCYVLYELAAEIFKERLEEKISFLYDEKYPFSHEEFELILKVAFLKSKRDEGRIYVVTSGEYVDLDEMLWDLPLVPKVFRELKFNHFDWMTLDPYLKGILVANLMGKIKSLIDDTNCYGKSIPLVG